MQAALKELCLAHKENLPTLLKHTIFNELSNSRNPNNMSMLHVMFSCDTVRKILQTIFMTIFSHQTKKSDAVAKQKRKNNKNLKFRGSTVVGVDNA